MTEEKLAINGGPKTRCHPMPGRRQFGEDELAAVVAVFEDSWRRNVDFGYQGAFEKKYTDSFCSFQGGGFADAVSSGTAAVYLAVAALELPKGSDVLVSPVTDPGSIGPLIHQGFNILVADASPDGFNTGPREFLDALTENTSCAVITHSGGLPCEIESIAAIAKERGIRLVEDCSQAHGALYQGKRIGCFGDIAAFSTMFSKNHSTGGCGGVVFTLDEELYWKVRAFADRGKSFGSDGFNPKEPSGFLFPALNFNLDELSCAIGASTLSKLERTIERRNHVIDMVNDGLRSSSTVTSIRPPEGSHVSPFFHSLVLDTSKVRVPKELFARAVQAEGIGINPDYRYVVTEWEWCRPYIRNFTPSRNAIDFRNRSFNLLFNERYTESEAADIVTSILKVEEAYAR